MNYESPVFVSIVLYAIYILLAAAIGLTVWSAIRGVRKQAAEGDDACSGPSHFRIVIGTAVMLVVILVVSWLTAGTEPLTINGKTYTDVFWLRTSGMMISTALLLICIIAGLVLYREIRARLS